MFAATIKKKYAHLAGISFLMLEHIAQQRASKALKFVFFIRYAFVAFFFSTMTKMQLLYAESNKAISQAILDYYIL